MTFSTKLRRTQRTAYHEAGHAVAAYCLDLHINSVRLENRPDHGVTFFRRLLKVPEDVDRTAENRRRASREAFFYLAGLAAERRFDPNVDVKFSEPDRSQAFDRVYHCYTDEDEKQSLRLLEQLKTQVDLFVRRPGVWRAVCNVADALLQEKVLGRRKVLSLLHATNVRRGVGVRQLL